MVAPGGVGDVHGGGSELSKELTDNTESTGTREGLDGGDSVGTDERAVPAEKDTLGSLSELGKTVDGKVLLIEGVVGADSGLSLTNDGEDVGFAVVITVGANTEVNLLGVLVSLEAGGEAEDRIGGGHRDVNELVVQSGKSLHVVDEVFYY